MRKLKSVLVGAFVAITQKTFAVFLLALTVFGALWLGGAREHKRDQGEQEQTG
tara:strand:- start:7881 stop:8039 length:159 start_codon:yes stop_codon:yes gene_type:complete